MMFKKMRRFAQKAFSSTTYIAAVANRFLPESMGRLRDFAIDREAKTLTLAFERGSERCDVAVENYAVIHRGAKAFVTFDALQIEGYLKRAFSQEIKQREIEIEPRYVKLVKKVFGA